MPLRPIRTVDVALQRVLLRADLDVPMESGKVRDDSRLRAALPTIKYLVEQKAKVIIVGHLGRPEGKAVPELRLAPVVRCLSQLGKFINLVSAGSFLDPAAKEAINNLTPGRILIFENIRFYPGEESADPKFAAQLAALGQLYVNDCFSTSHRPSTSLVGVAQLLPSFAGLDLENEVTSLSKLLIHEQSPLVVILGGKKKDKLEYLPEFIKKADFVLLGSGLATNLTDPEKIALGQKVIIGSGEKDLDSESVRKFAEVIKTAKTVIWGGPLGKFEDGFTGGSKSVAEAIIASGAVSIVGGGDTLAVLDKLGLTQMMAYASEAGGAMLAFMSGRKLPALAALGYYE